MKNIFILLFSITCLLAQDTKEVENTNEGKFSGVTYFDYTYLDSLGSFDIKRAELKYAKKLSEKYFFKMVLDVNRDISGTDIDKRLTTLSTTMDKRLTDLENKFTPIGDGVYTVDPNSTWPPSRGEYKMKDEMSRNKIIVLEKEIEELKEDLKDLENDLKQKADK